MKPENARLFRFALLFLVVGVGGGIIVLNRHLRQRETAPAEVRPWPSAGATITPVSVPNLSPTVEQLPLPSPTPSSTRSGSGLTNLDDSAHSFVGKLRLIVPVAGVSPGQLIDTFSEARSEGRVHDAIDIPAPQGTPVLAASDGQIARLFQSDRGGITIYQYSSDRRLVFYYAHLQRYAEGVTYGRFMRQGEVLAYVGDTGNAGAGNFHLHFSIAVISDPKRYWEGTNINPYPILRGR